MSHHHKECPACNHGCCEKHGVACSQSGSHQHTCSSGCCGHEHKCCCHGGEHYGDFSKEVQSLADSAWMGVLKKKIEEHIERHSGQQLDELAAIIACANDARWRHKRGIKKAQHELHDKLATFFHSDTCCKGEACRHEGNPSGGNQHQGNRHGHRHH